jgi:CRP-like cAMP-binding protein
MRHGNDVYSGDVDAPSDTAARVVSPVYSWADPEYAAFMGQVFALIEPRFEERGATILDECAEAEELFFVGEGTVAIGVEVNKRREILQVKKDLCLVGAYAIAFDERAQVSYQAITRVEGYSIRRQNWRRLMSDNPRLEVPMQWRAMDFYRAEIKLFAD